MRLHVLVLLAVAYFVTGCRDEQLVSAGSELSVDRSRIEFATAFVGFPRGERLEVRNRSRVPLAVTLRAEPPFTVEPTELELPGGAAIPVRVTFAPATEGAFNAVLGVQGDGAQFDVVLTGEALQPTSCDQHGPCVTSTFDPVTGLCSATPTTDGTPCSDEAGCITDGQCLSGTCVGTTPACDDGNACTTDACQPGSGCLHLEARCPEPANPCLAAFCDPVSGCGVVPTVDGTACGSSDCISASICLAGACRQVPVPEGAQCASGSPCQPSGVCQAQTCIQGPPTPLTPAWSYGPVTGTLHFDGVADSQDNVYWSECLTLSAPCTTGACFSCEVVSVTRDGVERWRQRLPVQRGTPVPPHAQLIAGTALVTLAGDHVIEARNLVDGKLLWARDLLDDYGTEMFDSGVPLTEQRAFFGSPAADLQGVLYVPLDARRDNVFDRSGAHPLLVALDWANGTRLWTSRYTGEFAETAVDEHRNVYLSMDMRQFTMPDAYEVRSFTPTGTLRWNTPIAEGRYPVAFDGHLITGASAGIDATSGAELWWKKQSPVTSAVMNNGSAWIMQFVMGELRYELVRTDAWSGVQDWVADMGSGTYVGDVTLTRDEAALMIASYIHATSPAPQRGLIEVDASGETSFSCDLPSSVAAAWGLTLLKDRVVVQAIEGGSPKIVAYDVPGRRLGTHGWVTERGSNARNAAPR